jgi:hypothetical protein
MSGTGIVQQPGQAVYTNEEQLVRYDSGLEPSVRDGLIKIIPPADYISTTNTSLMLSHHFPRSNPLVSISFFSVSASPT